MKFLASILLRLAMRFDRKRFEDLAARQARRDKEHAELVMKYFNEDTGPRYEGAPDWTPQDAANLTAFLRTETGQTLQKRFSAVAVNTALAGCGDVMHTAHSAGVGNGWNEAYTWFVKLSRVTGAQVTNDEPAPEGEAQLLERWSP